MRSYLTHATLVLPDQTLRDGALLLEEGRIAAICPETIQGHAQEISLEGDVLMPGLIDLHSDAIEREMEPRNNVRLPNLHAVLQGDRKWALAGITTMLHALTFAGEDRGRRSNSVMEELARLIHAHADDCLIENLIHCRFEMIAPDGLPYIKKLIDEHICRMVSLNNHSPGQGYFRDIERYRRYLKNTFHASEEELDRLIAEQTVPDEVAERNGQELVDYAQQADVPIASHDDEDRAKIERRHAQGIRLTEFPISLEAARTAHELGVHTIVGAPNLIRGGSHAGGVSALDLIAEGLASCICSDYAPSTLLPATLLVVEKLDMPLHDAVRLTTANPAQAARLYDRGEIRVGQRADLISIRKYSDMPMVHHLWSRGRLSLRFC